MIQQATFMNDAQISNAIKNKEMLICPYDENNLTPVGYNLSFSRFIVSLRKGGFVKIEKNNSGEWFFYLLPNETVVVLTREAIWVSRFIGGTFHSKVSLVTEGLGHVSTTLDPGWHGQLLVPINNPTNKKIRVVIAKEENGYKKYETFITMVLFRAQEASLKENTNKAARIELLEKILSDYNNKKEAEYLGQFIQRIKTHIEIIDSSIDLNDIENKNDNINKFQTEYNKMLIDMDNEFDQINSRSNRTYSKHSIFYVVLVFIVVSFVITIFLFANFCKNEQYKDVTNTFLTIFVPLVIFMLERLAYKFMG